MSSLLVEVLVLFALLLLNGLFAMSELAIISSRKVRLQQWAQEGKKGAQKALDLANSPTRFLSTVQIGITLVGIFSGAFGGATLADPLKIYFTKHLPALSAYADILSVVVVVCAITYLNILVGELLPKRFALRSPERIASHVAGIMNGMSRLASPMVRILTLSTDGIMKLVGVSPYHREPPVTQEEIRTLFEQGTQAGVFEKQEQDIVEKVLAFGDRSVSSIMTPRPDLVWLDLDEDFEENLQKIRESPHSYFPVVRGGLDSLIGTLHVKDLFVGRARSLADLSENIRQPVYVPETVEALAILKTFKQTGTHIAFVIDEYGSIQGIVTATDLLTAMVGDIPSSNALPEEASIVKRDDGSYLIDGMLPIEEFKALFDLGEMPYEDRANYQTLAGFVLSFLGRVPRVADSFEWNNLHIEVVDMDANRIDKVSVALRSVKQTDGTLKP